MGNHSWENVRHSLRGAALREARRGALRPGCGLQQDRPLLLHEGSGRLLSGERAGVVRRLAPRSPPVGLLLPPQVSPSKAHYLFGEWVLSCCNSLGMSGGDRCRSCLVHGEVEQEGAHARQSCASTWGG